MRYFEITPDTHQVINCILWDGVSPYTPPSGLYLISEGDVPGMAVGWKKINGVWTAPEPEALPDGTE